MMGIANRFILQLILLTTVFFSAAYFFSELFAFLIISFIISTILKPVVNRISYLSLFTIRIPRAFAILFSYLILLIAIGSFVILFVPLILEQVQILSKINYDEILYSFDKPLKTIERFLINKGLVEERNGFLREQLQLKAILGQKKFYVTDIINFLINLLSNAFIGIIGVFFISFFLLYDRGIMKRWFFKIVPNKYFELTLGVFFKLEKLLTNYLIGLVLQLSGIFTLTALGLTLLGIPYAITIAVFAALINIIPYIGPLIGGAFSIFVALTTAPIGISADDYLFIFLKVLALTSGIHLLDNILMQPLIFSKSVKAHPLEIFIAIFAGAAIAGVWGMIVAIPVYTILRVTVKEVLTGINQYSIFERRKSESPL